jgi:WhiB family redox-sensing transcriptional regulator
MSIAAIASIDGESVLEQFCPAIELMQPKLEAVQEEYDPVKKLQAEIDNELVLPDMSTNAYRRYVSKFKLDASRQRMTVKEIQELHTSGQGNPSDTPMIEKMVGKLYAGNLGVIIDQVGLVGVRIKNASREQMITIANEAAFEWLHATYIQQTDTDSMPLSPMAECRKYIKARLLAADYETVIAREGSGPQPEYTRPALEEIPVSVRLPERIIIQESRIVKAVETAPEPDTEVLELVQEFEEEVRISDTFESIIEESEESEPSKEVEKLIVPMVETPRSDPRVTPRRRKTPKPPVFTVDQLMTPRREVPSRPWRDRTATPTETKKHGDLINEAMLASIERTAFIDSVRMAHINSNALEIGNQRVIQKYGDSARRLLIVGPDTVFVEAEALVIKKHSVAELLGIMLVCREILERQQYDNHGFFKEAPQPSARQVAFSRAITDLTAQLVDTEGRPYITRGRRGSGSTYGIDDVLVKDVRHTKGYQEARELHSRDLFEAYILNGGRRPTMAEPGTPQAARTVMRKLGGTLKASDQLERFSELSEQAAAMISHKTDEYHDANVLNDYNRYETRRAIADTFAPKWQDKASCQDVQDPFYPPLGFERKDARIKREEKAKAICASCPILKPCLENALAHKEQSGIWGGTTEKERKAILAKRKV